jgi:hypothetical protein
VIHVLVSGLALRCCCTASVMQHCLGACKDGSDLYVCAS